MVFNYKIFKHELQIEKYLTILPSDLAIAFCHFRTWNHSRVGFGVLKGMTVFAHYVFWISWGMSTIIFCSAHTLIAKGSNIYQGICCKNIILSNLKDS